MDERTKELIAIGASISGHCQPCLDYHVNRALESGAGLGDIQTAIEIGMMIEKGAANAMRGYVASLFSKEQSASQPCCATGDSNCCG